ncbi:MAG: C40 family peptidase [Candidatus Accumulibacter sp.]|jgi:cell wall-associated NlpC family hydrolase|nr:C40 family peptidase [Accumulibacter sp.]
MCRHNSLFALLFAAVLFLGSGGIAWATERTSDPDPEPDEEISLLDRYANGVQDLILKGLEFVGINYRRGGTSPDSGFDCSGFVQAVFRDALGEPLPRTVKEQSRVGDAVAKNELKPGDLVFFNTMRRAFSHVGIYLGDNRFLHSPRTGGEIRVEDMSQSYWVKRYNGARRIVAL